MIVLDRENEIEMNALVKRWDGRDGAGFWDIFPYDRLK